MFGSLRLTRHDCQGWRRPGWPIPMGYSERERDAADALAMVIDDLMTLSRLRVLLPPAGPRHIARRRRQSQMRAPRVARLAGSRDSSGRLFPYEEAGGSSIRIRGTISQQAAVARPLTRMSGCRPSQSYSFPPKN